MGCLALLAAFNNAETPELQSALLAIADQVLGEALLILVAVGLAGYALWRFIQAFFDPEHHKMTLQTLLRRIGSGCSGVVYAALSSTAVQLLLGTHESDDGEAVQLWTALVLDLPFGQWLVGGGGVGVITIGIIYAYRACSAHFQRRLKLRQISPLARAWIINIGRVGLAARGIVFTLIGVYLIQAAYSLDAQKAHASDEVLQTLKAQPYGPLPLSLVSFGLIAYGVHMILQARYRQLVVDQK